MSKSYFLSLMLLAAFVACGSGQVPQAPLSLRARVERGLQRADLQTFLDASNGGPAQSYEVGLAVVAAGNTNDPFWIPYLKPFQNYVRNRNPNVSELARLAQKALAKLGEREQLQQIACEAEFGSPSLQALVVSRKLHYVGGWFSISILTNWLDESHRSKPLLLDTPGDEIFPRPQELALGALSAFVPDSHIIAPTPIALQTRNEEQLRPLRQAWRDWILKNEESLRKLTPTGDGLDLSRPTCKHVLTRDHYLDPYTRYDHSALR